MARIHLIENVESNTVGDRLKEILPKCASVDIAVSFISRRGLLAILPSLRAVARTGRVRVLTTHYMDITEPAALRKLLKVRTETKGRLDVRLSTQRHFHPKEYLCVKKVSLTAIIGSSNMTRDGLAEAGELSIEATLPIGSPRANFLLRQFEKHWQSRSHELTEEIIQQYEKGWDTRREQLQATLKRQPLLKLIPSKPKQAETNERKGKRYWRVYVRWCFSDSTVEQVERATGWGSKWTFAAFGPHRYEIGDYILVFDFCDDEVYGAQIKDWTECPTSEGRHFVAFTDLPKCRGKLGKRRWAKLIDLGIIGKRRDARRRAPMSANTWSKLDQVFGA